jgi:hypothetical protein
LRKTPKASRTRAVCDASYPFLTYKVLRKEGILDPEYKKLLRRNFKEMLRGMLNTIKTICAFWL